MRGSHASLRLIDYKVAQALLPDPHYIFLAPNLKVEYIEDLFNKSGYVKALSKEDVYQGYCVNRAPDIILRPLKDDLLIAVSGSGQTNSVVSAAQVAKGLGCATLAITSYPDSLLGEIVDYVVVIKGRTKIDIEKDHLKHQIEGRHSTLTPLGTLFEDSVMVFFDGIIELTQIKKQVRHRKII